MLKARRGMGGLRVLGVLLAGGFIAGAGTTPAQAYGPEGLFGGRVRPDNTIILAQPAKPQERPQRAQSVLERPRPDYDPVPLVFGSFEIFPAFETGASFDSNVYAARTNEESDAIIEARPSVNVFSNWNRHALALTAFGDMNFFAEHDRENYNHVVVDAQGRYDVMAQTWISGEAGYQHLSEPRGSSNDAGGREPVTFDVVKGGLSAWRGAGKLKANLDYDVRHFQYKDVPASAGAKIDQSFRDRTEHVVGGKLAYEVTANITPFLKAAWNARDYDSNRSRNSTGYEVVAGAQADFGGVTSAEAYVGWLSQDYNNFAGRRHVNDGVKFGGRFEWNVTSLTSLVLEANRTIEETTAANFNSFTATGGSATLTHELFRNILLEGNASYTHDDFNGTGSREDNVFSAGGGGRWFINRHLYTDLVYNWTSRDSSVSAADYDRHLISLRVGVQM